MEDFQDIQKLTKRLKAGEYIGNEHDDAIRRIADSRNPDALPLLRQAVTAAAEYLLAADQRARETPDYAKKGPGGWMIDSAVHHAKRLAESLRSAIDTCTPPGETPIYVVDRKKWWPFGKE